MNGSFYLPYSININSFPTYRDPMSVNMPAKYVGAPLEQPSADAGSCRLMPNSSMVRPFQPMIRGGRRTYKSHKSHRPQKRRHNRTHKKRKQGGGFFLPSIGESFVAAAAKYVAPLALYGIYKFATRKASGGKGRKRT